MTRTVIIAALGASALSGCYSEGIVVRDLIGTVRVPKSIATYEVRREVRDGNGEIVIETEQVVDVRAIGPVYVGLYAGVEDNLEEYPHPERGPSAGGSAGRGVSYPYGGTTVGAFRNACMEFLRCKVVSGRYTSYDDLVDWFTNTVGTPPEDDNGQVVATGEFIRQNCFQLLDFTEDDELRILPPDRDEDGSITAADLDFIDDGDSFVADFTLYQQEFFEGMSAWAMLDQADQITFEHGTCNAAEGYFENTYNRRYQTGTQEAAVLNTPYVFLGRGDWVSGTSYVWTDPFAAADLTLDVPVASDGETDGGDE